MLFCTTRVVVRKSYGAKKYFYRRVVDCGHNVNCSDVLTVLWRVIRKHTRCYFVAFNEFTTVRLQRMIKVRDYVMWAVVVAFGIGVIASVAAARVDKFLFG